MRPSTLLWLWWLRVRARWATELAAAIGIAGGVALVFAALVANTSMTGSVAALTNGVVGDARLQLIARGPAGMPETLVERARRLDAVRAAAPVIEQRVNVSGPNGHAAVTLLGGDARFAAMSGSALERFAAPELSGLRAVALPSPIAREIGLRPYTPVSVESGAGAQKILAISMREEDIGILVDSPVALMPLPAAQQTTGMRGRISRIFLEPKPGRDDDARAQVQALAGSVGDVRPANFDAAVFRNAAAPTQQSTTMFAVLAAGVGFLFAVCAVLLTAKGRAAYVDQLRLDGHSRETVLYAMLLDALMLGLVGAISGLLAGDQLSRHVLNTAPGYLTTGFPVGNARLVSPEAVVITVFGALAVAIAAVLVPLRRTLFARGHRKPVRGRSHSTRCAVAGVVAVLAAVAITWWWPTAALAGLISLTAGLLLLLPTILRGIVTAFAHLAEHLPASAPTYAAWQLRSPSAATITRALAATGAVAAFALVAIGGARDDLVRGLDAGAHAIDRNADVWITMRGPTQPYAVAPFAASAELRADLARIDGVKHVRTYRGSWLDINEHRAWVQAPPADSRAPAPPGQLREGNLADATARLRSGGSVILSERIATALNTRIGATITLPAPAPVKARVVAISNNLGWPSGTIIMNADDYATAWKHGAPSALLLDVDDAAASGTVAASAQAVVAKHDLPLSVQTSEARIALHGDAAREGLVRLSQITLLVGIAAALAMAAAMGGIILQRRPAIASRKVEGLTTLQMWISLLLEATILVGAGCVAGAAAGLLGQILLSRALETITGFPLDHEIALGLAAQIVVAIFALALALITIPGWGAARVTPTTRTQPT